LIELRFYIPLDIKRVISEILFPGILLVSNEKTKSKIRRNYHKNAYQSLFTIQFGFWFLTVKKTPIMKPDNFTSQDITSLP